MTPSDKKRNYRRALLVIHILVTIWIYPATKENLTPKVPGDLDPGPLGYPLGAAFSAIPYTLVAAMILHFLFFTEQGKSVREFLSAYVALVILATVGFLTLGLVFSPGSCSGSGPSQEYRAP